eukprot:m.88709 g.88709  ORF g.88709 m.88709 type:complete len:263 (+) comp11669_c0_seq1:1613-2401(+)
MVMPRIVIVKRLKRTTPTVHLGDILDLCLRTKERIILALGKLTRKQYLAMARTHKRGRLKLICLAIGAFAKFYVPTSTVISRGLDAGRLDKYKEGKAAIKKALKLNPESARIWNIHGILLKRTDSKAAAAAYRKAVELDPEYFSTWNNLGWLLHHRLKDFVGAEKAFRRAIEIKPEYATAWNNLGFLLKKEMFDYKGAEAAYRKAVQFNPNYDDAWNNLGFLLFDKFGDIEGAREAYRAAIKANPNHQKARTNLARLGPPRR